MTASLRQIVQPVIDSLGFELWHMELEGGGNSSLLRLYIEHADGITLEDCERVSREVSATLDVEDPFSARYRLEISSPGLERPLVSEAHFRRFIGEKIRVSTYAPVEGKRKFMGVLTEVDQDQVRLNCEGEIVCLTFADIAKARLAAV